LTAFSLKRDRYITKTSDLESHSTTSPHLVRGSLAVIKLLTLLASDPTQLGFRVASVDLIGEKSTADQNE
jgi:hypothetical protein